MEIKEDITKEEAKIIELKMKLDQAKTGFDRYVNTIVRSTFIDECTAGAYFNKLFQDLLLNGHDHICEAQVGEDITNKLYSDLMFGEEIISYESEKDKLNEKVKYFKRLESVAKCDLLNLSDNIKKKIIIDGIEQKDAWSQQFNRNSKVYDKLKELKDEKIMGSSDYSWFCKENSLEVDCPDSMDKYKEHMENEKNNETKCN